MVMVFKGQQTCYMSKMGIIRFIMEPLFQHQCNKIEVVPLWQNNYLQCHHNLHFVYFCYIQNTLSTYFYKKKHLQNIISFIMFCVNNFSVNSLFAGAGQSRCDCYEILSTTIRTVQCTTNPGMCSSCKFLAKVKAPNTIKLLDSLHRNGVRWLNCHSLLYKKAVFK